MMMDILNKKTRQWVELRYYYKTFRKYQIVFDIVLSLIVIIMFLLSSGVKNVRAEVYINKVNNTGDEHIESDWIGLNGIAGGNYKVQIEVSNSKNVPVVVDLFATSTGYDIYGNYIISDNQSLNKGAVEWVSMPVDKLSIGPISSTKVSFELDIPENIEDGEYTFGIGVKENYNSDKGGTKTVIQKVQRVYVVIGQSVDPVLEFSEIELVYPGQDWYNEAYKLSPDIGKDNISIRLKVRNNSDYFIRWCGNLRSTIQEVLEEKYFCKDLFPNQNTYYYISTNRAYEEGLLDLELQTEYSYLHLSDSLEKSYKQNLTRFIDSEFLRYFPDSRNKIIQDEEIFKDTETEKDTNQYKSWMYNKFTWVVIVLIFFAILFIFFYYRRIQQGKK